MACPVGDVDPGEISRKALKGWGPGLWGSRREPVSTLWTCPRQATGRERMVAKEHTRDRCKDGWGSVTQREQSEGVGHKEKAWKAGGGSEDGIKTSAVRTLCLTTGHQVKGPVTWEEALMVRTQVDASAHLRGFKPVEVTVRNDIRREIKGTNREG